MHAFIFEVVFQIQQKLLQPVLACYDIPGPCQAAPWWTEFWSRCALVPAGIPPLGFLPSGEGSSETGAHRTPHSGLRHIIINVSHTHSYFPLWLYTVLISDQSSITTFIHEERLASENFISHRDVSWIETRFLQPVLSAQLSQQLRRLQTVSPGIITFTNRSTHREEPQVFTELSYTS